MESAPNNQKTIAYLNAHGHSYSNEKALIEACRDCKNLQSLLNDLLQPLEPSFIRNWMATETSSFSKDFQRNRASLPAINSYLAQSSVLSMLKIPFRLNWFLSKQAGDRGASALGRIVNFLQSKEKLMAETEQSRIKYKLMFKTYKNATDYNIEKANKRKQVQIQKEQERPLYEQQNQQLRLTVQKADQMEGNLKKLIKQIQELEEESKDNQVKYSNSQRLAEHTEIKIAQYRRQLIKFAPDIKKEKEHQEVKLEELKSIMEFKHRIEQHIADEFINLQNILKETETQLQEQCRILRADHQRYIILSKQEKEEQNELNLQEPVISQQQQTIKQLEKELKELETKDKQNQLVSSRIQAQEQEIIQQYQTENRKMKALQETLNSSNSFHSDLQAEKSNLLTTAGQKLLQKQNQLIETQQYLQDWYNYVHRTVKSINYNFNKEEQ